MTPLKATDLGERVRIVIADDHDLYRRGLQDALQREPGLEIVAEAASCDEAVEECIEFGPEVVLLGHRTPGNSAIEACAAITQASPRTKILILTASDDEAVLFAAYQAGATGYLLKDMPTEQIIESIRLAHGGQSMIPPRMTSLLLAEFTRLGHSRRPRNEAAGSRLTHRERQVLQQVSRGKVNREIAAHMFISENTVKIHVRAMMTKLQVNSRVEAALFAVRHGLVEADT
ncbi:response regulator transcription factor [Knoellia sp. S7-12]|uniref:response regulator transcription factor n=1 Tax=Knoellia sp. S7-12 TaxID=3126698 RepID=UPI0033676E4C